MQSTYPAPDRTGFEPNFSKTSDNDVLDIGWAEGVLSDLRPWWLECWAQDRVTCLTIFVARAGLDLGDDPSVARFLEREGLLRFTGKERYATAAAVTDQAGHAMWSINVVVGDDDNVFVTDTPAIKPYRGGAST